MRIAGKAAVVTGGASGLGLATAAELARRGASVAIVDLPSSSGDSAVASIGPAARFLPADVTSDVDLAAAVAEAAASQGLDIAVACAGVATGQRVLDRSGAPMPLQAFERVVTVNLVGSFNLLRLAAAAMARRPPDDNDDGERGVIVMTASIAAFEGQIGQTAYAASKGGVVALTLAGARDLASYGIRVAAVAPGTFDTPMLAGLPAETRQRLADGVPHPRRLGRPEEFAALVAHIVENPMLNGEVVRLDGALRMPPR